MTAKYGNRNVPKMIAQVQTLRAAIASEGTPAIQNAWGAVEEHIDFAYRGDLDAAHRAGYDAARADALTMGVGLLNYDAFMRHKAMTAQPIPATSGGRETDKGVE